MERERETLRTSVVGEEEGGSNDPGYDGSEGSESLSPAGVFAAEEETVACEGAEGPSAALA